MKLAEYQFVAILKQNIRPAQPIDSPELLQGRSTILRDIKRTLHSPGMHVFIHGERGIGKTSIALTVAKSYLRADPPLVGCDENSTFEGIVGDIYVVRFWIRNTWRKVASSAGVLVSTWAYSRSKLKLVRLVS
jgi:hypothetical protein